ncbi:NADH-quinone oxidoreductase subunit NuoK [Wolbachia endosymbiont of Pentidionis agamae]|uniref:NADH-quinone oxidoreductase subunit NuoK n=1 Tax=Wolbachia endosymbiont of Pentidionis agamae TaxID=3110435 RepID=UPI002FD47117
MEIGLNHFLILAAVLFIIGVCGILINRRSIIHILLSIEIMLLAVNVNLVAFSVFMNDIVGQIFVMFILTVAAVESVVGLAILVVYYRKYSSISVEQINLMKE